MTNKKPTSFLDWEDQFKERPKSKKEEFSKVYSFYSFITILPAWRIKKNYALILIKGQKFKLMEKGNGNIKNMIKYLAKVHLYINPDDYNTDIEEIFKEVYQEKIEFKDYWNQKLEVY